MFRVVVPRLVEDVLQSLYGLYGEPYVCSCVVPSYLRVCNHQNVLLEWTNTAISLFVRRHPVQRTYTQNTTDTPRSTIFRSPFEVQVSDVCLISEFSHISCPTVNATFKRLGEQCLPQKREHDGPRSCLRRRRLRNATVTATRAAPRKVAT